MSQDFQLQPSPIRTAHLLNSGVRGYSEGKFTPTLGGTATYLAQSGDYTRIGNRVFVDVILSVQSIGTGSTTVISGLPAELAVNNTCTFTVGQIALSATAVVSISGVGFGTQIFLYSKIAATATDDFHAIFGNGTGIILSGTYRIRR